MIDASSLTKEYRSRKKTTKALDSVSLSIGPGEVFGLLGPNGAGKTTFVKCALGLLRPTAGSITLLGRSSTEAEARRDVGFVPELVQFQTFLTAREVMTFHARLKKMDSGSIEAESSKHLEWAGLAEETGRVTTFSKGMLRRLGLAQALIGSPRVLILDEPTADLDPIGRRQVRDLLGRLKDAGTAILLNSHLFSEVERVCDRVAILHKGRVLAQGAVDEIVPKGKDLEDVFIELVEGRG